MKWLSKRAKSIFSTIMISSMSRCDHIKFSPKLRPSRVSVYKLCLSNAAFFFQEKKKQWPWPGRPGAGGRIRQVAAVLSSHGCCRRRGNCAASIKVDLHAVQIFYPVSKHVARHHRYGAEADGEPRTPVVFVLMIFGCRLPDDQIIPLSHSLCRIGPRRRH